MKLSDFDFHLPQELIAQTPIENRSESRLLVVNTTTSTFEHEHFSDIIKYLRPTDVLVRNNTKVIPARLFGTKPETNAHVELLILDIKEDICKCLVGNAKVVKLGSKVSFGDGELIAECIEVLDQGLRKFKMHFDGVFLEVLQKLGEVPLPPYIKAKLEDPDRYQTVYAKIDGSAAAPTAGLHFTQSLIKQIEEMGVQIVDVTLHVGLGTFKPVDKEDILEHKMHEEAYWMSKDTADVLNKAKENHHRIICVGTTSARTIETIMTQFGCFKECEGTTEIFIYPGYTFKAVDALITNFHLPKSTLLMMISAFCNRQLILDAYQEAINHRYRFFSFGDSMFLTKGD
ncbi:MAG: tRNA preQ1(34) S-adenosylmethionine ribosyltransferase-isomerase QueA [Erysipelotrichaceae bacterium]|nr:tRNA preQ1(34) S-adenosylmethionine ribosyltransferase-isomerase QueA [Erysipelotrichaceae bacterium]MDP3304996.1 tRNA preQ1(34) S-adenosylmethionine ribosyltransferase-isomerase QueA [Erysipelotrichaceae bacterium]